MSAAFFFTGVALVSILATIAIRDHRRAIAARLSLFDHCRGVLDRETWSAGDDGFPALDGWHHGRAIRAVLFPDTMVVRRLPQLWLSLTDRTFRPGHPVLSILVRPTGNEYYAPIMELPRRIEPPAGLPFDIQIRGDGPRAEALCRELAPILSGLFADVRIKEITLSPKGTRLTRQASEGRRGEHLLLRQAVFDGAEVERDALEEMLAHLDTLSSAYARFGEARAA